MTRCITCATKINRNKAHIEIEYEGHRYLACCPLCQSEFEKEPEKYIAEARKLDKTGQFQF